MSFLLQFAPRRDAPPAAAGESHSPRTLRHHEGTQLKRLVQYRFEQVAEPTRVQPGSLGAFVPAPTDSLVGVLPSNSACGHVGGRAWVGRTPLSPREIFRTRQAQDSTPTTLSRPGRGAMPRRANQSLTAVRSAQWAARLLLDRTAPSAGVAAAGGHSHCRPSRATPRDEDEAGANEREDGDDAQDRPDGSAGRRESRRVRCGRWAHRGRRRDVVLGAATSTRTRMWICLRRFRNPGTPPPSGFPRTTASALCRGSPKPVPNGGRWELCRTTAATRSAAARIRAAKCNQPPKGRPSS
jgi:hypothetical protein